jgi:recombination protein RecR
MIKSFPALDGLIETLGKLPGVGRRSAGRMAAHLAVNGGLRSDLESALAETGKNVRCCSRCGSFTTPDADPCALCTDSSRDGETLCVVENPSDVILIERAGGYRGRYHVLFGRISPMNRQGPEDIRLQALKKRLDSEPVKEIIIALDTDVESEATAGYIREMLAGRDIRISRPAIGIPAGSAVAYSDPVTVSRAFKWREPF